MLRFFGKQRPVKNHQNPRHFSMSQVTSKKKSTNIFWRVGKVTLPFHKKKEAKHCGGRWPHRLGVCMSPWILDARIPRLVPRDPEPEMQGPVQHVFRDQKELGMPHEQFFFREAPDTFNFLRHVMRAIWSVRPKCSHRCVSLRETPLKPVQSLRHTTKNSAEQTVMRTKWFKHIAI